MSSGLRGCAAMNGRAELRPGGQSGRSVTRVRRHRPEEASSMTKQALGRRRTRHLNRGTDCGLCRGHERAQPMTSTEVRVPFLHGLLFGPTRRSIRAGFSRARGRVAQFAAPDGVGSARKSRPHRFLDLHLHQLAAHASLCPRLGREIPGSRIGGDRRPCAGVRI